jgi:hypothetical protein
MTQFDELTNTVSQNIDVVWEDFEANVQPGMNERTAEFATLAIDIPAQIEACVNEAVDL